MLDVTEELGLGVTIEIHNTFESEIDGVISFEELFLLKIFHLLHQIQCFADFVSLLLSLGFYPIQNLRVLDYF